MVADFYSPRTSATNVLVGLCKLRSKDCLQPIVSFFSEVLHRAVGSAGALWDPQHQGCGAL